jgi:hypothetical protein
MAGMQKRPWKIIAHVSGLHVNPGWREYFIVMEADAANALATLRKVRPELLNVLCEVKGLAPQDFLEWVQMDGGNVYSIMVVS